MKYIVILAVILTLGARAAQAESPIFDSSPSCNEAWWVADFKVYDTVTSPSGNGMVLLPLRWKTDDGRSLVEIPPRLDGDAITVAVARLDGDAAEIAGTLGFGGSAADGTEVTLDQRLWWRPTDVTEFPPGRYSVSVSVQAPPTELPGWGRCRHAKGTVTFNVANVAPEQFKLPTFSVKQRWIPATKPIIALRASCSARYVHESCPDPADTRCCMLEDTLEWDLAFTFDRPLAGWWDWYEVTGSMAIKLGGTGGGNLQRTVDLAATIAEWEGANRQIAYPWFRKLFPNTLPRVTAAAGPLERTLGVCISLDITDRATGQAQPTQQVCIDSSTLPRPTSLEPLMCTRSQCGEPPPGPLPQPDPASADPAPPSAQLPVGCRGGQGGTAPWLFVCVGLIAFGWRRLRSLRRG